MLCQFWLDQNWWGEFNLLSGVSSRFLMRSRWNPDFTFGFVFWCGCVSSFGFGFGFNQKIIIDAIKSWSECYFWFVFWWREKAEQHFWFFWNQNFEQKVCFHPTFWLRMFVSFWCGERVNPNVEFGPIFWFNLFSNQQVKFPLSFFLNQKWE